MNLGAITMRKKTTKDKILYILKKDIEIAIKDLMDYFSISEVAVRKHLNELIRQGFVRDRTVKKAIGRPYHVYALTGKGHQTFPNEYEDLPIQLLQDLELSQGKGAVHRLLNTRKEREEAELGLELTTHDFPQRVKEMVDIQEERGYMIEMREMETGGYEIKNFNCPIFNLASNYKIVCSNEKDMYRKLFPESKIASLSCLTSGGKYCCWTITEPEKEVQNV